MTTLCWRICVITRLRLMPSSKSSLEMWEQRANSARINCRNLLMSILICSFQPLTKSRRRYQRPTMIFVIKGPYCCITLKIASMSLFKQCKVERLQSASNVVLLSRIKNIRFYSKVKRLTMCNTLIAITKITNLEWLSAIDWKKFLKEHQKQQITNPNVNKEKKLLFLNKENKMINLLQNIKKKSGKDKSLLKETRIMRPQKEKEITRLQEKKEKTKLQEAREWSNLRNKMKREETIMSLLSSIAHLSCFLRISLNKPNKSKKFKN